MTPERLKQALSALGETLQDRGEAFDLAVVAGGSLLLLGLIDRPTRDLDIVAVADQQGLIPAVPLPQPLVDAVRDVADLFGLDPDWVNAGPADLLRLGLPEGFEDRAVTQRFGALTLRIASRYDQICFKLYAAVDQGPNSKHTADLRVLEPTNDELISAAHWARTHDPSAGFRGILHSALRTLGVERVDDV